MKLSIIKTTMTAIALTRFVAGPVAAEGEHVAPMKQLAGSKVAGWAASPVVIAAINAQNTKHASLAQGDVDKMDKTWRAEVKSGGGAMTKSVLGNALSGYLKKVKAIPRASIPDLVMDNKGLNVGQSDVTSDYWQGLCAAENRRDRPDSDLNYEFSYSIWLAEVFGYSKSWARAARIAPDMPALCA